MTTATHCPQCGLILAANAPAGLCPGCLFQGALETHFTATSDYSLANESGDVPPTPADLAADFPELEILRFVGRGGMGMVYQARQKQLDRMVALKILSPRIARDAAFAERFAREARTLALLSHPHVVTVYDFGTTSATGPSERDFPLYYLLMEFVDGLTLRQLLDASQLTPQQAFAIVPQICEALQYAHDKGVVHRDIKPENILLDRQGIVKIADFGLAKLMGLQAHDLTISTTGQVLGTLHYMAPEQVERPLEVDHRADIYSLGVVFYQMLTGELPLGRFAPPSEKAHIDVRLDEVVLRALEKEPGRRFQQASALQSQVESIAATPSEIPSNPIRPARTKWLMSFRKPRIIAAMIIGTAILSLFVLGFFARAPVWSGGVGHATPTSLADMPDKLRSATKDRVIEAGLEKPLIPWAWQELERRTLTVDDGEKIMTGLVDWLHREHPNGLEHLHWLDNFLERVLDKRGLISDLKKVEFLEALTGKLHGPPSIRIRQATREVSPHINWDRQTHRDLFGLNLLNELQSITLDGQPVTVKHVSGTWKWNFFWPNIDLPPLSTGKHTLRFEVLSAFVWKHDVVGMKDDAKSNDWPPANKKWVRSLELDLFVFSDDAQIVRIIDDESLAPESHGLKVEPILVRKYGRKTEAVLEFVLHRKALPVPISFDVSMNIAGQAAPHEQFWAKSYLADWMQSSGDQDVRSGKSITVKIPEIGPDVLFVDVVLTPNPKWIELEPDVNQIWGKEVVFKNVPLRRLDLANQ